MGLLAENENANVIKLRKFVADGAKALQSYALAATRGFEWLWSLPQEELLALLNNDVQWTLSLFNANTTTGKAVNLQLDGIGLESISARCPVEILRKDIGFDQTSMQFIAVDPSAEQ